MMVARGVRTVGARTLVRLADVYRGLLAIVYAGLGPAGAYAVSAVLARLLYALLPPLRWRSVGHCRAALGRRLPPHQIAAVAAESFVQRIWNLTDLLLAPRLLHPGTVSRYGGRPPAAWLADLHAAQARRQPLLLITAYFGPFELLPLFFGLAGVAMAVVYRPHENAAFDRLRHRVRGLGGCELVPDHEAVRRVPQILATGGTVALVADHAAPRHGVPITFFDLPTTAPKTVGLLAQQYGAEVVVAGLRRVRRSFRFEFITIDVIRPPDWSEAPDPIRMITQRYVRGLEQLICTDPTQYAWAYARWGEEVAQRLAVEAAAK